MSTAVYIICSPRPRVGKTLLARLLTEYLAVSNREVIAFDLSNNEPSLLDFLPKQTETAHIRDTLGQMQLMDRLIVNDGVPKVLDIDAASFDGFFKVLQEIGFLKEAARQGVTPIVLFVLDQDSASSRAYTMLARTVPPNALVAVSNEAVLYGEVPPWVRARRVLEIKLLPDFLKGYVAKTTFSFNAFARNPSNSSSELYDWIRGIFLHFREIELSLILRP
jgi:hypothetical protein